MKKLLLLSSLITLCTAMTCDDDYYVNFNEKEFNEQRKLWENLNHTNYSFTLYYFSSATGPTVDTIQVKDGVILEPEKIKSYAYTINDVFKRIEDDIYEANHGDTSNKYGATMNITYNKTYHYPEKIRYSVEYIKEVMGGNYYDLEISNFHINQ